MKYFDSIAPFPLLKDCTIRGLLNVIHFIPPLPQIHKKWGAEEGALYPVCLVASGSPCITNAASWKTKAWNMIHHVICKKRLRITLTHWGRVTHICVGKLTIIGSDNGLSPDRRQTIIWTNAGLLLIGPLGTNFSEILIGIQTFSLKKMHLKMSSAKWRPLCLGLNVLSAWGRWPQNGLTINNARPSVGRMLAINETYTDTPVLQQPSLVCSTPSHYLNQCCIIVNRTLKNRFQSSCIRNPRNFIQENAFENVVWKIPAIFSGPQIQPPRFCQCLLFL